MEKRPQLPVRVLQGMMDDEHATFRTAFVYVNEKLGHLEHLEIVERKHPNNTANTVICVAQRTAEGILSEEVETYWQRFVEQYGTGYVDDAVTVTRAIMLMPKWKWLPAVLKLLIGWGQPTNPYKRQREQIKKKERLKQQGQSLKREFLARVRP